MTGLFLFVAAAAAAAFPSKAHEARALNMAGIITADDYPVESLRNDEQGIVGTSLLIDPTGTVRTCTVTKSSGFPALDERTCEILKARAKFDPATDRDGQPIETTFTQRFVWKLASDASPVLLPRTAWVVRYTIGLGSDGKVLDCHFDASGFTRSFPGCATADDAFTAKQGAGAPAPPARPVAYAITESMFFPVEPNLAPAVASIAGATMTGRQVSRLTITPDGQVIACEAVHYSGDASPAHDSCAETQRMNFDPVPGGGPVVGTIVQSTYSRPAGVAAEDTK